MSLRLILVDDHPIVLDGLQQLLQRQPGFTVIAARSNPEGAPAGAGAERRGAPVLDGLQQLLQRQPDFTVIAACSNAEAATAAIRNERPDVLVLDLRMPGINGLEFLRQLADRGPSRQSGLA